MDAAEKVKELRISLPLRLHLELYAEKVTSGASLSETIVHALDQYFAEETAEGREAPSDG